MASIKVKFKPSTVADHEGSIFYQIIHERKQRQLFSDYHVFPIEWDESRSMVTIKKLKALDLSLIPKLDYARDMFMMSFMLRGIRPQ